MGCANFDGFVWFWRFVQILIVQADFDGLGCFWRFGLILTVWADFDGLGWFWWFEQVFYGLSWFWWFRLFLMVWAHFDVLVWFWWFGLILMVWSECCLNMRYDLVLKLYIYRNAHSLLTCLLVFSMFQSIGINYLLEYSSINVHEYSSIEKWYPTLP